MLRQLRFVVPLLAVFWAMSPTLQAWDETPTDGSQTTDQESTDNEDTSDQDESPPVVAPAEDVGDYAKGDVAWMLVSIAFVLMMTCPGLALFYGGLVRKKNILSVMMQCMFLMGLMSVLWAVVGYSLAFGGDNPYVGNFDHLFLQGVAPDMTGAGGQVESLASTQIIVAFQGMFFIITPALI